MGAHAVGRGPRPAPGARPLARAPAPSACLSMPPRPTLVDSQWPHMYNIYFDS